MEKKSVVDKVTDYIIQGLIDGKFQPGDQLPTEPELCETLEVGRNSVREAIKKMQAYGLVYIQRPDGTFISDRYNHKMLDPILYSIILQNRNWYDFVEMRKVLDIGTLHVVVGRETPPRNLQSMRRQVEIMRRLMEQPEPDVEAIVAADVAFHRLITDETNNEQLSTITDYVTRLTVPSRTETTRKVIRIGDCENFIYLHEQLVDIIENKRADLIDKAVIDHYMHWK